MKQSGYDKQIVVFQSSHMKTNVLRFLEPQKNVFFYHKNLNYFSFKYFHEKTLCFANQKLLKCEVNVLVPSIQTSHLIYETIKQR